MQAITIVGEVNSSSVFETIKTEQKFQEWTKDWNGNVQYNHNIKFWRTYDANVYRDVFDNGFDSTGCDIEYWDDCDVHVDMEEISKINTSNMHEVDCYTYIYEARDSDDPNLTEDEKDHCDVDFCVFVLGNKIIGFQTHED